MIAKFSSSEFQRVLQPDLNESEFGVLSHFVRMADNIPPSRLAALFQMTRPSMTAIISSLEAKGYAEITASDVDRRQKLVTITKPGRKAYAQAAARAAPLLEEMADLVDIDEIESLLPLLQHLREVLDTRRNERDGLA